MTVKIITLGCKVNQYESQAMEQALRARGHAVVPFAEEADAYIVNTCSVTAVSDQKSRQVIHGIQRKHPGAVVAVCGCYPQTHPEEVRGLDVDLISGTGDRLAFLDLLEQAQQLQEMSNATITVNLNGYAEATVTTSSSNIQVINPPASGNPEVTTTSLEVTVVGPEAQVTRLTGDAVSVQVDLSNFQTATGTVEVPATVSLTGSMAESCWVAGEYTVSVNFSSTASSGSSATGALAAAPQE